MTDTTVTTEAPTTPPPQMNDDAARSSTGEILDQAPAPKTEAKTETPPKSEAPAQTSTSSEKKDGETKPTTPEAYTAFTAPEGYTLDTKTIEAATPIFRELGLTQAQAQKLVDFHAGQMIDAAKGPAAEYESTRTAWKTQYSSDPELKAAVSGDKTGLDAVQRDIGRAIDSLGDAKLASDFREAMNITGAGDHPAFIKAFWKFSQHITEGKHVAGTNPSVHGQTDPSKPKPSTGARALYPNLS